MFLSFHLGAEACTIIPRTFCSSINQLADHAILTGVIVGVDTTGIDLLIVDVLRGEEERTTVRIWDGTDFDCNGWWSLAAANIGNFGDSVVVLVPRITEIQNDWDVIGDYRWEDPYFYTASLSIEDGNALGFIQGIPGAPPEVNTFSVPYSQLLSSLIEEGDCSGLINMSTEDGQTSSGIRLNNPVSSILNFQLSTDVDYEQMNLYSTTGQLVFSKDLSYLTRADVDLSQLPAGVYFLEIRYGPQARWRDIRKVVKT